MASINYAFKEISCKIVFYGPGLSGKTTNLQYVHQKIPPHTRGDLISLATDQDRTLYFDFLPVDIGKIHGFSTKFQLYTVPGQVYYNATRKLVLRGVDGLVFVADSQKSKMDENLESLQNLVENLSEYGYHLDKIPLVFQYNKRDLSSISSVEELERILNPKGLPYYEAVASKGIGVFDTLKCISKLVLDQAKRKQLFQELKTAFKQPPLAEAEVSLSPLAQMEPVAAVVGSSTSVESPTSQMTTIYAPEKRKPTSETIIPEKEKPEMKLKIKKIPDEEKTKIEKPLPQESPTIISWSAGKKTKPKGSLLWRFFKKFFNR